MNGVSNANRALLGTLLVVVLVGAGCGPTMDWSPDGRYVVATDTRYGQTILSVRDVRTGAASIVPHSTGTGSVAWSPDGRWIAFERTGVSQGLYLYHLRTKRTVQLVRQVQGPIIWREDSTRFLAFRDARHMVCLTVPDAYPVWEAELPEDAGGARSGVWIPDTDIVALLCGGDIWLIEGAEPVRITTTGDVIGMALRPGGRDLIWARQGPNARFILLTIYRASLKHRSAQRLDTRARIPGVNSDPSNAPIAAEAVVFSPDGKRMAVLCSYRKGARRKELRLFCMTLTGAEARLVAVLGVTDAHEFNTAYTAPAVFSRDGKYLAFWRVEGRSVRLMISRADGTETRGLGAAFLAATRR